MRTPCDRNMGHGSSCTEDYLCDSCKYIRELKAELKYQTNYVATLEDQMEDNLTAYRKLEAQLEQKPIRVSVKPDGQVWVVFNAGEGREATLNLNNIVLAKESVGITKGIMLDAIAKALEEVK